MKLKALFILVFVVGVFTANAQVPGYMGRKTLLTFIASPALQFPYDVASGGWYGESGGAGFAIRPRLGAMAEYTVARNRTIGFKYSYLGLKTDVPAYYDEYDPWGDTHTITADASLPSNVSIHSLCLRTLKYRSGNLPAPLGVYTGWGLGLSFVAIQDKFGVFVHTDGSQKKGTYLTSVLPDVHYYFGVRRGIGERMMWSITTDFNLAYLGYVVATYGDAGSSSSDDFAPAGIDPVGFEQHRVTKGAAQAAHYNSSIINITLELSFLPF